MKKVFQQVFYYIIGLGTTITIQQFIELEIIAADNAVSAGYPLFVNTEFIDINNPDKFIEFTLGLN